MIGSQAQKGFSLVEVIFALAVLLVGVLGVAAVLASGARILGRSPGDVVGAQKAAQAVEAVFAARDSQKVAWTKIRNVNGSGGDDGIFLDGPQPLKRAGSDGLVNTADDAQEPIESIILPGADQLLGTADDETVVLSGYTREISIRDVANENGNLRSIAVTITYHVGTETNSYTLTTYISGYS